MTPWPRPRQSRAPWPEARSSESAVPRSRPCRTGTAAPEMKRSDDPPHAPWFASATHGASAYPQPQPSGIPSDPFSRRPYDLDSLAAIRQDHPGQQRRANELSRLTSEQIRRMDRVVEARQAGSLETARDLAFGLDDHRIEAFINQIRGEEDQLLIARLAREQRATTLLLVALIASGVLAFG